MKRISFIFLSAISLLAGSGNLFTQEIDPNFYYRLTTHWQGDGKSLDVINDGNNNRVQLAPTSFNFGQFWKFTPLGMGYYRVTNQWQDNKALDIVNDRINNNQPVLAGTTNATGQHWKITPLGNGFYRLTTLWQGDGKSLDILNDGKSPALSPTGIFSGQYWKFTKLREDLGFHMIIASDPQWAWTSRLDNEDTGETEDEKNKIATILNENHVKSMNRLIDELGTVKGLILNGDLTAYGHPGELQKFKSFYTEVKVPLYAGLGNHDYANNVNNTFENHAANRMVEYVIDNIRSNSIKNSDYQVSDYYEFPTIVKRTTGSLAYSWDIGNVHFVQLHNYPIYHRSWDNFVSGEARRKIVNITSALNWLETDLAYARRAGKIIILNYHDSDDHWGEFWSDTDSIKLTKQFGNILTTYDVAAVFVGHYHTWLGKDSPRYLVKMYDKTPVFYCGSASQSKFLLVHFRGNRMNVEQITSLGGNPAHYANTEYTLYDLVKSVEIPKQDGWVTFFNQAGYVARYTLSYTINGQTKTFATGNMALGNKQRYAIPAYATNIRVKGEGQTGIAWEPWNTTFNRTFTSPPNQCFKSYGTTLNQSWNNDCN